MSSIVGSLVFSHPCFVLERLKGFDWDRVARDLDTEGNATLERLVSPDECRMTAALYGCDELFRSRVVMGQHGFGRGEYKYFSYPLPDIIEILRASLYWWLAAVANRWNTAMGVEVRYPKTHVAFIERCHHAGQVKPTPLLLQ